jgi:hypothetical protein
LTWSEVGDGEASLLLGDGGGFGLSVLSFSFISLLSEFEEGLYRLLIIIIATLPSCSSCLVCLPLPSFLPIIPSAHHCGEGK